MEIKINTSCYLYSYLRIYDFEYKKRTELLGRPLLYFRIKLVLVLHAICPNPCNQITFLLRVHGLGFKN